jgi:hypothetical protein
VGLYIYTDSERTQFYIRFVTFHSHITQKLTVNFTLYRPAFKSCNKKYNDIFRIEFLTPNFKKKKKMGYNKKKKKKKGSIRFIFILICYPALFF